MLDSTTLAVVRTISDRALIAVIPNRSGLRRRELPEMIRTTTSRAVVRATIYTIALREKSEKGESRLSRLYEDFSSESQILARYGD